VGLPDTLKEKKMFKRILLMLLIIVFALAPVCYGANNWGEGPDTNQLLKKVVPNYVAAIGGPVDGGTVSAMVTGSTAIPVTYRYVTRVITTTVGEVQTLADGSAGQLLTVLAISRMGSGTAIVTPTTKTGFTTVTLDAAFEYVTLLFIDTTKGWVIVATNGTVA
jgi:hypothetical protein